MKSEKIIILKKINQVQEIKKITSKSNPTVKSFIQLQSKRKERDKTKKFVIEGRREVRLAIEGGYNIEKILFCKKFIDTEAVVKICESKKSEIIEISEEIYSKLAYRGSTEGILAIANQKKHDLPNIKLSENPLILIAENVEKPGNLGAMLRTCDATAIDVFIIANPLTDLYNPNIIRSSIGTVFTVQTALARTEKVIEWLKEKSVNLYAATLQNSRPYYDVNFRLPSAIAVGSEASGLTTQMREAAMRNILIPMKGKIDSLNVSVSAAIFLSEAIRQRSNS